MYQLIPYDRIRDHFQEQLHIPVCAGSIFNFNQDAYVRLAGFEQWVESQAAASDLLHADETGINITGKRYWLHSASNSSLTLFQAHTKRGSEAMDDIIPARRQTPRSACNSGCRRCNAALSNSAATIANLIRLEKLVS